MHVFALSEFDTASRTKYLNYVFKTVQIHLPFAIHQLFLLDSWFAILP